MSNKFVSFLKSVGTVTLKVLDKGIQIFQKVEPGLQQAFPGATPFLAIADQIVAWIKQTEANFAAVGQTSNGPAKLNAVVAAMSTSFDQWIQSQLPGDVKLQDAANYLAGKQAIVNGFVQVLNSFSATQEAGAAVATGETIIAAAAAKAAAPTTPTAGA